ncbi:MAG: ATP synthase subunit I [Polaromonas sp.]|nr:MAG: ATP synthase subunit I [Polaromonas sp.]
MRKINPSASHGNAHDDVDQADQARDDDAIKALSRSEAQALREKTPLLPPSAVLMVQIGCGLVAAAVAWLFTSRANVGWSALYGTAAVVVPSALFARGLSRVSLDSPGAAVAGFFVWEAVKIVLTVAMLIAAPKLVVELSWLAMLAGFVVTMKAYWLALWLRRPCNRQK